MFIVSYVFIVWLGKKRGNKSFLLEYICKKIYWRDDMGRWIKISATVDEEFYHGTTTGENDSILKNVISGGLNPKLAMGWGQGAGFYIFDNENAAKSHSLILGGHKETNFFTSAGNKSTPHGNCPMVLRLPVKYDSSILDIDYEQLPNFGAIILIALKDLIMTIPDKEISYNRHEYPKERIEVLPSKMKLMESSWRNNRGIKIPHLNNGEISSLTQWTENYDGDPSKAEHIGKICEYLKVKFPSQFKEQEDKIFERIKNRKNQDAAVAFKYNGKYNIHIDPSQDIQVYSDGKWISGSEYLNMQKSIPPSDVEKEEKPELMKSAMAIRKIRF